MKSIIVYRDDVPPLNDYPRQIVSPRDSSACCHSQMVQLGQNDLDDQWRFYYKRCAVCGFTVRRFYAPSLLALFEVGRELRVALAEMNLGAGPQKRRTRAQLEADRAAARRGPIRGEGQTCGSVRSAA